VFNLAFKDLYAKQDVFSKSLVVKWDGRVLPSQERFSFKTAVLSSKSSVVKMGWLGFQARLERFHSKSLVVRSQPALRSRLYCFVESNASCVSAANGVCMAGIRRRHLRGEEARFPPIANLALWQNQRKISYLRVWICPTRWSSQVHVQEDIMCQAPCWFKTQTCIYSTPFWFTKASLMSGKLSMWTCSSRPGGPLNIL